jgi:hypothetical protein
MSKANTIQTNFTAGEISPLVRGRVDVNKYANGADELTNFIVKPQGPIVRRSGTELQTRTKDSTKRCILRSFEFSNTTTYMLEFGNLYCRILKDGAPIFPTDTPLSYDFALVIFGVTADNKIILNTGAVHGLVAGQWIEVGNFTPVAGLDVNKRWMVEYASDATHVVLFNSYVGPGQGVSTNGRVWKTPIELVTPYLEADLDSLYFAQSADILFVTSPSYQSREIRRYGEQTWTITLYATEDGPYAQINNQDIELVVSSYTDVGAILCSTAILAGTAADNTKYIEFRDGDIWRLAKITAFGTTTVATVDVVCNVILGLDASITLKYAEDKQADMERQLYNRMHPKNKLTDPGAGGGVVTANFANTFSENDVGKYVRILKDRWHQITVFTKDTQVTVAAAPTFIAYTYPATNVRLTSRSITAVVTASAALFAATDVGRQIRLNFSGRWLWCTITAYTSTTVVSVSLGDRPLPLDSAATSNVSNYGRATEYKLGAWSDTTGWPQRVQFHEQRIVFARTTAEPQSLWMSRSADFTNMAPTDEDASVPDDAAIAYSFASNEVNAITWLETGAVMLIGTSGGEWQARASTSIQEPITPKNISILQQTDYGSIDNIRGFKVGSAVLFVQRSGRKVREMTYSFELDKWVARDVTIIAEHILRRGGKAYKACYQKEPTSILWIALTDGTLVTLTYDKDQEVVAWAAHTIQSGAVEAIVCTPSNNGADQEVYMVVKRTISAATIRTIEKLRPEYLPSTSGQVLADAFFVDGGLSYTFNPAITDVHGLGNLEGLAVMALADGIIRGPFTVASGFITLPVAAQKIQVGLKYVSRVKTLTTEGGSPFGTSQGKTKRIDKLAIRVSNSVSVSHGTDLAALTAESFSLGALFSGDYQVNLEAPYSVDSGYYLQTEDPVPLIICALMPQPTVNE